jgi:hypothetical protein
MEEAISRVCRQCGVRKPLDAFRRADGSRGRRTEICKECRQPSASDIVLEPRICSRCKVAKPITAFPPRCTGRDGLDAACRECVATANRARYLKHRDRELARRREHLRKHRQRHGEVLAYGRNYRMVARFGITVAEWERLFEAQGSVCAICGRDDPDGPNWHTDHCHDSGKVRGILCRRCNLGLGWFDDSPEKMRLAARYIQRRS